MTRSQVSPANIVLQVFETMAFMNGVNFDGQAIPESIDGALASEITFSGPSDGRVQLWAPTELIQSVAELLGVGEDTEAVIDTFSEITNVVAGQVLTEVGHSSLVFDLGIPKVRPAEQGEWNDSPRFGDLEVVDVDGHCVIILVSLN